MRRAELRCRLIDNLTSIEKPINFGSCFIWKKWPWSTWHAGSANFHHLGQSASNNHP